MLQDVRQATEGLQPSTLEGTSQLHEHPLLMVLPLGKRHAPD